MQFALSSGRTFPFHSIYLAAFPVLAIFSQDVGYVGLGSLLSVLVVTALMVAGVSALFALIFRNVHKGGLMASLVVLVMFSFTPLLELMELLGLARQRYLLAADLALLAGGGVLLWRARHELEGVTQALNKFTMMFPLIALSFALLQAFQGGRSGGASASQDLAGFPVKPVAELPHGLPDIYYVVLDGYGRNDVLKELFHYSNGAFLDRLRNAGFEVVDDSSANYSRTPQSICSALNMDYMHEIFPDMPPDAEDFEPLAEAIQHSAIVRLLRGRYGYKFVAFASGYHSSDATDADYYLGPGISWGELGNAVLQLTPLPLVLEKLVAKLSPYTLHRNRTLFVLEQLPSIADIEAPTFTFAHIIGPHPPFLFGATGEDTSPRERPYNLHDGSVYMPGSSLAEQQDNYRKGYVAQLEFIGDALADAVEAIQESSSRNAIVIVQGDHGPFVTPENVDEPTRAWERFSILNAYALPGGGAPPPAGITPVNSFRLILQRYFGSSVELLPQHYYWSRYEAPYAVEPLDAAPTRPSG
jgi:hypothetical protein